MTGSAAPARPTPASVPTPHAIATPYRFPRPRRAFAPVGGTIFSLLAWAAIAHNSGAGWVQTLGALLGGFLVVGLIAPAFVMARARLKVVACPADATAGEPLRIECDVTRPLRLRPLSPPGEESVTGRQAQATVVLEPTRRGEIAYCVLEVATAAPFGLLWWAKIVEITLPRPVLVAPRIGTARDQSLVGLTARGEDGQRIDARVGEPRGVRPYRPGDLRHWVNWPATAHTGTLMVREMEGPTDPPVTVQALLPDDLDDAERAAEQAMATVALHLRVGRNVLLVTDEGHGPSTAPVGSVAEAGRRLARAAPFADATLPPPPPMTPHPR